MIIPTAMIISVDPTPLGWSPESSGLAHQVLRSTLQGAPNEVKGAVVLIRGHEAEDGIGAGGEMAGASEIMQDINVRTHGRLAGVAEDHEGGRGCRLERAKDTTHRGRVVFVPRVTLPEGVKHHDVRLERR